MSFLTSVSSEPTVTEPIKDITIDEDAIADNKLNLNDHFSSDEGDLTFSSISSDNRIDVTINQDGSVDLVPAENWYGAEEITIVATDGDEEVDDTLHVRVEPKNDPPKLIGTAPESLPSFDEDQKFEDAMNLHHLFFDIDSIMTFRIESQNIFVKIGNDGSVDLSAPENWHGTEEVEFIASDGEYEEKWRISVTVNPVNDAPKTELNLNSINLGQNTRKQVFELGEFFSDLEDESLLFTVSGNSRIRAQIEGESGKLTLQAPDDWSGKEVITVTARDSEGSVKNVQVVVIVAKASDTSYSAFYFTGMVLALAIAGVRLQYAGRKTTGKCPVKLEDYRHYKGQ
jgi:hypothetical protein